MAKKFVGSRRLWAILLTVAAATLDFVTAGAVAQTLQERLQQCGTCHGEGGNSTMANVPSLAGQPELFITNQLILFREKLRKSEIMEPFAKGMSDADILAVAAYYAKLAPEPSQELIDKTLADKGAALTKQMHCSSCHLPDYSGREQMPRLARQRIDYTIESLKAYREGARYGVDTTMNGIMYQVSDEDIRALAHFVTGVR